MSSCTTRGISSASPAINKASRPQRGKAFDRRAIAYEGGRTDAEEAHGVHEHGVELFTRGVQSNAGLGFGVLIFGVAMGALFAVLFCVTYGRVGSVGPRLLSVLLAAGAFVSLYLVPFVKYPPNPPAVGQSDTIGMRTGWYLVMVLAAVLLAAAAVLLARRLTGRFGAWNGRLIAVVIYLAVVAVLMALLPTVDETPEPLRDASGAISYPRFPADVLYEFRLLSLGAQLLLWATIGLVFAPLAARLLGEPADSRRASSIAA